MKPNKRGFITNEEFTICLTNLNYKKFIIILLDTTQVQRN